MSDQFVSEIRMFAGNFAPAGWALCNGQLMAISQNTALFSLLGTTFGGDGRSTFGLPNLQGCAPMFFGQGPGLSLRVEGESGGEPTVTLLTTEMPAHNHQWKFTPTGRFGGSSNSPAGNSLSNGAATDSAYAPPGGSTSPMSAQGVSVTGGGQPHNNWMPYQCLTFIIALQGIFPARS